MNVLQTFPLGRSWLDWVAAWSCFHPLLPDDDGSRLSLHCVVLTPCRSYVARVAWNLLVAAAAPTFPPLPWHHYLFQKSPASFAPPWSCTQSFSLGTWTFHPQPDVRTAVFAPGPTNSIAWISIMRALWTKWWVLLIVLRLGRSWLRMWPLISGLRLFWQRSTNSFAPVINDSEEDRRPCEAFCRPRDNEHGQGHKYQSNIQNNFVWRTLKKRLYALRGRLGQSLGLFFLPLREGAFVLVLPALVAFLKPKSASFGLLSSDSFPLESDELSAIDEQQFTCDLPPCLCILISVSTRWMRCQNN